MNISIELKVFAKDLSILVVEDDKDLNQQLVEIAKLFFQNVKFAYDGKEALALYSKEHFDIVLSDITMPFLNGVDLSKKIKNIDEKQNIIILSAHSEVSYLVDLIDIGIRQFVHKPFDDQELLYRLLKVSEEITLSKQDMTQVETLAHANTQEKKHLELSSHTPMSSKEFVRTLESDPILSLSITEDIDALVELNEDFQDYIGMLYLEKISKELLLGISMTLKKIFTKLSEIDAMRNISFVLFDLATFIEEQEFTKLNEDQMQKFRMLEFIYDDISRFIETVFVYKDTIDVHYLEDSLKSSVEQLKNNILNTSFQEEELELF